MNKSLTFAIALFFFNFFGSHAQAMQTKDMQGFYKYYHAPMPSYSYCHSKLKHAGYLSRGRGAKNRNFMITDACMRNGGHI
jgi:hypothetical protein